MKAEFLNPFVYACMKVLGSEAGLSQWALEKPYLARVDATGYAVNVVVGVAGSVQGIVVYGLDLSTAKGILHNMIGSEIPVSDPMADSALGELGNLITGLASGALEESGYPCRISPPAIVKGTAVRLTRFSIPMVAVPITTDLGVIRIYLFLNKSEKPGR